MRNTFTFIVFSILSSIIFAQQPGDTVVVETFSYSDPAPAGVYSGDFQFPAATEEYQKILMEYSLKCDPSTRADRFACGEWDYLSYTYLWDSSGVYDSTFRSQQTLSYVGGGAPDSLEASTTPSTDIIRDFQTSIRYLQVNSSLIANVGFQTDTMSTPFEGGDTEAARSQFLWEASELSGLGAGDITAIEFELPANASPSTFSSMEIGIQHTALDSLDPTQPVNGGFTQVMRRAVETTMSTSDSSVWRFTTPFTWDGTSNLLIEVSYEFGSSAGQTKVLASPTPVTRAITTSRHDYGYMEFDGFRDMINCGTGPNAAITGNNPRTIEAWARVDGWGSGGIFQAGLPGAADRDFSLRTTGTVGQFRVQLWGANDFNVTLPGSDTGWHHYAVSYDGSTVRLYYDGEFVTSRTANLVSGSGNFLIGRWNNSRFNGAIDEVRVWDQPLSAATINEWKIKPVDANHPDYANLVAYYPIHFTATGTRVDDFSGNNFHGTALGGPQLLPWRAKVLSGFTGFQERPNVTFIRRNFTGSIIDTVIQDEPIIGDAVQLVEFGNPGGNFIIEDDDPANPSISTDTLILYQANTYSYIYLPDGTKYDSTYVTATQTYSPASTTWFSNVVRFEIGRFITPYGIGLDLGPDGKTWYYDVTDYAPLLHDMVRLQSGNNQELHNLRFLMIKGEPARNVLRVQNVYDGNWSFASIVNGNNAAPRDLTLDASADAYRIKTRTTGHGFGGSGGTNCSEFCQRFHSLNINGVERFQWLLWNECSYNPLPSQGGTWVYDRAGWCPGDIVNTYDWELTPLVQPGATVNFDYEIDDANRAAEGNWILRTQLVSYDKPNHQVDVTIEDVVSPNVKHRHGRWNPICGNPKVIIGNRGTDTLKRCIITYGVKDNGLPCYYEWTGNLAFQEQEEVELPLINWIGAGSGLPAVFFASVSQPNFQADGYDRNNYTEVPFERPAAYETFVIDFTTNMRPGENKWTIFDTDGNIVKQLLFLGTSRLHSDTIRLPEGCYLFLLEDSDDDGIAFFANNDGNGSLFFRNEAGQLLTAFDPDFGGEIRHAFTVGYRLGDKDEGIACSPVGIENEIQKLGFNLFPNPSSGQAILSLDQALSEEGSLSIYDAMGRVVWEQKAGKGEYKIELNTDLPQGTYWVEIRTANTQGRKAWVIL